MSRVEIRLFDPFGEPIAVLDDPSSYTYSRRLGHPGDFQIELPPKLSLSDLAPDSWVEFWRAPGDDTPQLDTEAPFLIREPRDILDAEGRRTVGIGGPSAVELLSRRIVAYAAGTSQAEKDEAADRMMLAIVRENFGDLASAERDISDVLRVDPSEGVLGLGPTVRKGFSRRSVLTVLQEIEEATAQLGTRVFYDVVRRVPGIVQFHTYVGHRGMDHSSDSENPVVFSAGRGNLESPQAIDDYGEEVNAVYAGGQGEAADRQVVELVDSQRASRSPVARRETFVDARDVETTATLTDEARQALEEGRPRFSRRGRIVDTDQARYGQHWGFGDRVVVGVAGEERDVVVTGITVSGSGDGSETIDALFEDA